MTVALAFLLYSPNYLFSAPKALFEITQGLIDGEIFKVLPYLGSRGENRTIGKAIAGLVKPKTFKAPMVKIVMAILKGNLKAQKSHMHGPSGQNAHLL